MRFQICEAQGWGGHHKHPWMVSCSLFGMQGYTVIPLIEVIARERRPPAKDPPNSQAYIQTYIQAYIQNRADTYLQAYIQTYIQNRAEAIHTSIPTSNTHKHIHKTKQTHIQQRPSQTAPQKTEQQKYITLYNSKYCIR